MSDTKPQRDRAMCRGCGRCLDGDDYRYGGFAYIPAKPGERGDRKQAKVNFYGGYVCSRECDYRASLALERTMPGHRGDQVRLSSFADRSLRNNWEAAP